MSNHRSIPNVGVRSTAMESLDPGGSFVYATVARIRDLILASVGLLIVGPFLLIIIAVVRLTSGASGTFSQTRVGKDEHPFTVYKIRTLRPEAPTGMRGTQVVGWETPVGKFLRRYKLDELPQLLNVVKGDMSLVGPRPVIPDEFTEASHRQRLRVRPGVTGLWQLSRVRDLRFDRNPEYDLFYLANRSLAFDAWLIWRTVLLMAFKFETKIRMAVGKWEKNSSWRALVPQRSLSIPPPERRTLGAVWLRVAIAGVLVILAPPGVGAWQAKGDIDRARASMDEAGVHIQAIDREAAEGSLREARSALEDAHSRLSGPLTWPASKLPLIGRNLKVVKGITSAALTTVDAGFEILPVLDTLPYEDGKLASPISDGRIDLQPFVDADPKVQAASLLVDDAYASILETPSTMLIGPVADARQESLELMEDVRDRVLVARAATFLVPRALGSSSERRWIVAAENLAELRGRGGYLGTLGTIVASDGELELQNFRSTDSLPTLEVDQESLASEYADHYWKLSALTAWQNLTMSPHFPSGAQLLLGSLEKSGLPPAQGVISMDPKALEYLLEITGPVQTESLNFAVSSENVVDWSLNTAYFQFEERNLVRKEVLAEVADAVWGRLLTGDIDARRLADALGQALSERRLVIYSTDPAEQALIHQVGIGGEIAVTPGDFLMVVGQNVGENKIDYYVERDISYQGRIHEDGSLSAKLRIAITNDAPAEGLPDYIGGPRPHLDLAEGTARIYLEAFVPKGAVVRSFSIDGERSSEFRSQDELARTVLITDVEVPPSEVVVVEFSYVSPPLLGDGGYRLTVQNQSLVKPDSIAIEIEAPSGVRITERSGFFRGDTLWWQGDLTTEHTFTAELRVPLLEQVSAWLSNTLRRPVG